jgi:type I restriction enzyme S subunit
MVIIGGQVDPRDDEWADVTLIAPNHIESDTGKLRSLETARDQGADSGKYRVHIGQILYSKIRPRLNKVAIAPSDCLCSADMYAMTSLRGESHEYFLYFMLSEPFLSYTSMISDRVKMPKVNREELSAAPWLRPPLAEQLEIVEYIRRQTATIDALISNAEEFITLTKERRSALITAAVTGQINVEEMANG